MDFGRYLNANLCEEKKMYNDLDRSNFLMSSHKYSLNCNQMELTR